MTINPGLLSFNSGEISRFALARIDLAKNRIACEEQLNFLPSVLGPAMLRPGTEYVIQMPANAAGWLGSFVYSETETVLLVMISGALYFLLDDVFLARPAVSAAVANGDFATDLASWTDSDEAGAISDWIGGALRLTGTGTNYAFRDQQVTVTETGTEHALRVVVLRNRIVLKIGTSAGDTTYLDEELGPGTHSFAFTPIGDFWIRVGANTSYSALVESVAVESAGMVALPVPYSSTADFDLIRYDQSGDVIFAAGAGVQQRRIERRSSNSRSWGVALYQTDDGPFRLSNRGSTTLTPSATTGSITLTASRDVFKPGHVGALFRLVHPGQSASGTLAALNDTTGNIRITGLAAQDGNASQRAFTIVVDGSFSGTITLQRSLAEPGSWTDVESYTGATSKTFDDGLDNQIIYYRLEMTAYTSGTADVSLTYNASAQTGIVRLTAVANTKSASADVLRELGALTGTSDWAEGEWSDYRGWPNAVALHDGRLVGADDLSLQASVSDGFESFDADTEGDAGPINKIIATGGNDGVRWLLSLQRLIAGTATQEISIRASTLDGPLTPTDFVARVCSTRGVSKVPAIKVGTTGIFVQRNNQRVFELAYDFNSQDYQSKELTRLKQEMCEAGVVSMAVQMQPDTRIWFVLADGRCAVLTYEKDDEVVAWVPVDTDGSFERVAVQPGNDEDRVSFIVRRTINSSTVRYIERLAKRSEARAGTISRTVDSHIVYSGAPTTLINAPHLAGKQVSVWADGQPVAALVTLDAGGHGTLPSPVPNYVAGLPYSGRIKTAKLAYGAEHGTPLTAKKRVSRLGLVMADVTWNGIRIGRDFDHLMHLPTTYRGRPLTAGEALPSYDAMVSFNGEWSEDPRVCIEVLSPYCCTLMGIVPHMETNEFVEPVPQRDR